MWLVLQHGCELKDRTDSGLTSLAVACTAMGKQGINEGSALKQLEVVKWLVNECSCSVHAEVIGVRALQDTLHGLLNAGRSSICLLYTSDAADEEDSVDLGGRRIIKKKKRRSLE
eukprot:TRINITY_DN1321_c0_g1_i3.p3 TRINITY_DN1321_c0_g1~~TRINITY_DN1321_c0_g1_i3.p3  ORF type:complete len:115 (+),score=26.52 TRINITY_DN1321_c0_g1_i3:1279-1623(+)